MKLDFSDSKEVPLLHLLETTNYFTAIWEWSQQTQVVSFFMSSRRGFGLDYFSGSF